MKARPWVCSGLAMLPNLLFLFAPGTFAQQNNPARMVRLSRVEGQVLVSRTGNSARERAHAGERLRQGDTVYTGDNGHTEIGLENGATLTLETDSALQLDQLAISAGHNVTVMTVKQGNASFHVRLASGDVFRLVTSTFDVTIPNGGACQIHTLSDGAWVQTLQGRITVSTKAGSTTLAQGQEIAIHSSDFLHRGVDRMLYPNLFNQLPSQNYSLGTRESGAANALNKKNANILELPDLSQYQLWMEFPRLSFTWPGKPTTPSVQPGVNGNWELDPRFGWMWQTNPNPTGGFATGTPGTWHLDPALGWIHAPGTSVTSPANPNPAIPDPANPNPANGR